MINVVDKIKRRWEVAIKDDISDKTWTAINQYMQCFSTKVGVCES